MHREPIPGAPDPHLIGRAALSEQGLSARDIARLVDDGRLIREGRGVYRSPSDDPTPAAVLRAAAVQESVPDAVITHRAGALQHGLPLARPWERPELTYPGSSSHLRGTLCHRYRLEARDVVEVGGLRVTSVARTLVDVARVVPMAEALVPMDFALGRGLVTRDECRAVLARLRGINFRWRIADVIDLGDPLAESPLESFSRGQLVGQGVPQPLLQVRLSGSDGTQFFADMFWEECGVVGECDGRVKYGGPDVDPDALWKEKLRQEWLEEQGLGVLRWGWREADRTPAALAARWRKLAARRAGWVPSPGLTITHPPLTR